MAIYFISDLYLLDNDMAVERGFSSIVEYFNILERKWNATINKNDAIYILGNIANSDRKYLDTKERDELAIMLSKLNGIKFLILGSKDIMNESFYKEIGFIKVYDKPIILNDLFVLSNEYMYFSDIYINIYGNNELNLNVLSNNSFCVSAEKIDYTPVIITDIFNNSIE